MAIRTRYERSGRSFPAIMEMPESQATKETAYHFLAVRMNEHFLPEERVTIRDIWDDITRPMGISFAETRYLVKEAIRHGYLKRGKVISD